MKKNGGQPPPPTVTVVVCCRKCPNSERARLLYRALITQTLRPHEILFVLDTEQRIQFPGIHFIHNRFGGLSNARNCGISCATGDYIAFVDDDATPDCTWLSETVRYMQSNGLHVCGTGVAPQYQQGSTVLPDHLLWLVGCTSNEAQRPIGCSLIVCTDVANQVWFAERFGKGSVCGRNLVGEDTEFIHYATQKGYRVGFLQDTHVRHAVPMERTQLGYLLRRAYWEGRTKALIGTGSTERHTLWLCLRAVDPLTYAVVCATALGYLHGKLRGSP